MKAPMLNVGASKESVAEARSAIMDILKSDADQSTKVVALEALTKITAVTGTAITNCTFSAGAEK